MKEKEIWKPVVGFEKDYLVSNFGNVKRKDGKMLKASVFGKGYLHVNLSVRNPCKQISKQIHRLVAEAFISNPKNLPIVNHKDENPLNNFVYVNPDGSVDESKSNLEWCTMTYNLRYGTADERKKETIRRNNSAEKAQITSLERSRPKARRAVVCLDSKGNFIAEFSSIADAQRKTKCFNISQACRDFRYRQSGGYLWRYSKDYYK